MLSDLEVHYCKYKPISSGIFICLAVECQNWEGTSNQYFSNFRYCRS